jgi:hypothetical protein
MRVECASDVRRMAIGWASDADFCDLEAMLD